MAVALRSVGQSPGANSTSCVITKPTGLTVGDLMVAHVFGKLSLGTIGTFTAPANWNNIRQDNRPAPAPYFGSALFWKIANSGDVAASDFTFTATNAVSNGGTICALTGHDATTPINAHNGAGTGTQSTTVTSPEITPTVANCIILLFCGIDDDNTQSGYAIATDNPASWDEAYDLPFDLTQDLGLSMGYALRPETSATGNGTATTSASDRSTGQLIAIAPGGATYTYTYTENIKVADSVTKTYQQIRSDTIKLADTIVKTTARVFSDGIKIADALTAFKAMLWSYTENIKVSDGLQKTINKTVSDTIKVGDTIVKTTARVFTDGIKVADSLAKIVQKSFTEGIKLADSLAKTVNRVFTDTIKVSDILRKWATHLPFRILQAVRNLPSIREDGTKR